jgi:hypothetical protein
MTVRIWSAIALLCGTACATGANLQGSVVRRAAFDLQCDAGTLVVFDLPGRAYGVRGCGRQATYVFTGGSCQNPRWLTPREAEVFCTPVLDHLDEGPSR